MRIGILIPTRGIVMRSARRPNVDECWAMARYADAAGYDAVWVGDSVVAKPRLEPLTTLAYIAGITERVRLGTAVLMPALRHPVVLAHQIANVDQISRGRVVMGLGVGWSLPSAEREWAACGADHKRRVRRLEEHVAIWRMLWRGEPVTHRDGDVDLTDHTIGPLPWNPAGPPVLITAANRGEMLAAQFDRFGRLGDGIITTYVHAEECRLVRERAEEALARYGRAKTRFELCVYTTVRMDDDPRTAERVTTEFLATYYGGGVHSRGTMGLGPADAVIAALQRYAAAGVSDLCIRFVGDDQLAEVEEVDAPFARPEGKELLARIYRPRGETEAPLAALVDVHGGAWSRNDRLSGAVHGRALAASGLVVVSLDFRQGSEAKHPAASADVAAGLRYVRAHARRLGVDPRRIGIVGSSSGAQLALLAGLKPGAPEHAGTPTVLVDGSLDAAPADE